MANKVSLIIPALNEEASLPGVLAQVPQECVAEIVVVDNGSSDGTAYVARQAGARVVREEARGYGAACRAGVNAAGGEILVFMDGDGSFCPAEIPKLTGPIIRGSADLVLGSRTLEVENARAIPLHARMGNRLITTIIGMASHVWTSDLGPFRAIRRDTLDRLRMKEMTYGWPSEMILKASKRGCRVVEVPITYRPRSGGKSKVSGNLIGSVRACISMLKVVARWSLWKPYANQEE